MRYGVLLQYLGSLLLELGRTTMMLRINPVPSEAVVNSGPALFISPSGPNPLMVPPAPFFPGTRSVQMGPIFSSLSSQGSVLHPRDVDIHVRTSGSVPVASTNPSEPVGAQQAQERTDRTGNTSHANISEAFAGVGGANVNGSDARNGQSPNEPACSGTHANQQPNPQSSQVREAGNLGSPIEVNVANSSQTSPRQHNSQGPFSQLMDSLQWIGSLFSRENARANGTSQHAPMASTGQVDARNRGTPEVSGVNDEGLRFANLVRQIMPFITQVETQHQSTPADSSSTPSQAVSESLNSARDGPSDSRSSHQHNREPVDGPNSKRQRTSD